MRIDALKYFKNRLKWSDTKIINTLHLPSDTINAWFKKGIVSINNSVLQPNIQAVIHLLAIHRSLEAMFTDPIQQRMWLSTFHPELNVIPEKLMSESSDGLIFIRHYLDYVGERGA